MHNLLKFFIVFMLPVHFPSTIFSFFFSTWREVWWRYPPSSRKQNPLLCLTEYTLHSCFITIFLKDLQDKNRHHFMAFIIVWRNYRFVCIFYFSFVGASRIIDSTLRDEIFIRELKRLHGIHTTKSWCIWMRRLIKDFRDETHACNFNLIASSRKVWRNMCRRHWSWSSRLISSELPFRCCWI